MYPGVIPKDKGLVLLGNKLDLKDQEENIEREIHHDTANALAEEMGARFLEVSAKTGENIPDFLAKLSS